MTPALPLSELDLALHIVAKAGSIETDAEVLNGYDPERCLAESIIFDGSPTEWAADVIGIPNMEWDTDDDRLIADNPDYEIITDAVYGHNTLLFGGDVIEEDLGVRRLKLLARVHRFTHN